MKQKWAGVERRKSLRMDAEALVADVAPEGMTAQPAELLMHELLVHKVALELQDVELQRANVALKEARERHETELRIADTAFESQQGMMVTDANGTILRVNQVLTVTTGYSVEEMVGQNPRMLKSGRHDARFFSEMWASISRIGSWEGEIWNKRKNGEIYAEYLAISAVKNTDGIVTNYVASYLHHTQKNTRAKESV